MPEEDRQAAAAEESEEAASSSDDGLGIVDEATALAAITAAEGHVRSDSFAEAIALYSAALSKLSELHGESGAKMARPYLSYAVCLLRESQTSAPVINPKADMVAATAEEAEEHADDEDNLDLAVSVLLNAKACAERDESQKELLPKILNALGEVYHEQQAFEEAAAEYQAVSDLLSATDPKSVGVAIAEGCRALALRYAERVDEANAACRKALEILNTDPETHRDRIEAISAFLGDDESFEAVQKEAKDATVGTHALKTTATSEPTGPVTMLQPRKKRKVEASAADEPSTAAATDAPAAEASKDE
ncbi:hypothetical protein DIPPA_01403 [Diplonema papillatum]|nr:hypothetical protein DIPPA_01403 [Diplonema papillatum]